MKTVFLDRHSIDTGDINYQQLDLAAPGWLAYEQTTPKQVTKHINNAEIVITNKVELDNQSIKFAKNLRLICVAATGTNNVDIQAAVDSGVAVCNVNDYATTSVSEHVFTLILTFTRQLKLYQTYVENGAWEKSDQFCVLNAGIGELANQVLGIVGYGTLGRVVEKLAKAFGMQILLCQRPGIRDTRPRRLPLHELLPKIDILSLHCPLTNDTRNLIGKKELALMKKSAILINTARGAIVDEKALLAALSKREIFAAGIDVLSTEPPRDGNCLLHTKLDNLILTPHIAWASQPSRQRLLDEIAENIRWFKMGKLRNSATPPESFY